MPIQPGRSGGGMTIRYYLVMAWDAAGKPLDKREVTEDYARLLRRTTGIRCLAEQEQPPELSSDINGGCICPV